MIPANVKVIRLILPKHNEHRSKKYPTHITIIMKENSSKMCEKNTTLLLILLAVTVSNNSIDSKIVYPARVKSDDVNSLLPLRPKQALPLIFFNGEGSPSYQFPMGLTQVEIIEGQLASKTEFYTIPPSKQIFFCPNTDFEPTRMGVFEANFENSQVLECEHEPEPILSLASVNRVCGPLRAEGVSLDFVYKVMFGNVNKTVKMKIIPIYKLCFSKAMQRVKFVEYKTVSANLHSEALLAREREIKFEGDLSSKHFKLIPLDYQAKLYQDAKSFPDYGFQLILPPEYMALYSWRKNAYHYANVALQHKNLINLWNEIHTFINKNAIEVHQLPRTIITGLAVIPLGELPKMKRRQICDLWVTLVLDTNVKTNYKGVAILMHNFIIEKSEDQGSSNSTDNTNELYIDKICGEDLCVNSLRQKFHAVRGQVRCCKVTEDIKRLFYWKSEDLNAIDKVLEIGDITYEN